MKLALRNRPVLGATLILSASLFAGSLAYSQTNTSETPDPAASFTVFMGLDLRVDREEANLPVLNSDGKSVEILKNGRVDRVSLRAADVKVSALPRVGRTRLEITNLAAERVYSRDTDPAREALRQQILMDSVRTQAREIAEVNARGVGQGSGFTAAEGVRAGAAAGPSAGPSIADVQGGSAMQDFSTMPDAFDTALPGSGSLDPAGNGRLDAYEVTFELSSPVKVERTYGVLLLNITDPKSSRQQVQVAKFFELPQLGPKARRISVVQEHLPPGFSVVSHAVHIFDHGREFPTNLSRNAVSLTEDDAHQFLILKHMQENREGTHHAEVLPELLPAEVAALLVKGPGNATVDLDIDANGRVVAVQGVHGVSKEFETELRAALKPVRFLPALASGDPVPARGTFALSDFMQ